MIDPIKLIERCLREADGDTEAGLAAAEYILVNGLDASLATEAKKFHRPENYEKIRELRNGKVLYAGANDWESGWTWASIHSRTGDDVEDNEPDRWINVDHDQCPGCNGDLNAVYGKKSRECYEFGKKQVAEWAGVDSASLSLSAFLAHDIANRAAQGVLNWATEAARAMSADARRELGAALDLSPSDSGAAILAFVERYRLQLAKLLTQAQLAAVLEGAREVAAKVPALEADAQARANLFGNIQLPTFPVGAAFSGHDVSDEPRDEDGKWTKGSGETKTGDLEKGEKFNINDDYEAVVDMVDEPVEVLSGERGTTITYIHKATGDIAGHAALLKEDDGYILGDHAIYDEHRGKGLGRMFIPTLAKRVGKIFSDAGHTPDAEKMWKSIAGAVREGAVWVLKSVGLSMNAAFSGHDVSGEPRDEGGKWIKGGGEVWKFSDDLPDHDDWKDLEADPDYFYHASNTENAANIQESEMKPHRPWHGTEQSTWPDGSTAKRIYFTDKPKTAWQFAPEGGKPVLLRVKKHKLITKEKGTSDFHLEGKKLPAHLIEILTSAGWKLLKKVIGLSVNAAFTQGISSLVGTISEAVKWLAGRNVVSRPGYDALDAQARQKAFTVAGVDAQDTLAKIRDALAENVREGASHATFRAKVLEAVDAGTFLSPNHLETVFRTNVQTAFSEGQLTVLQNPRVQQGFPYAAYDAIHDSRARHNHLELEKHGIGGSNVYRSDDPVFQTFRPPWDYNCRCSWTPLTVRQAAEAGVEEAQAWKQSGVAPLNPARVSMPPFAPPDGFQRAVAGAPLSVRLSMQPMGMFDPAPHDYPRDTVPVFPQGEGGEDYPRDGANRFLDKYRIANAVQDSEVLWALRESLPEAERPKLDAAAACLRDGGCIHHPSEPAGMGVNAKGAIADPLWAEYAERWDAWSARDGNCEDSLKRVCAFRKQVTSTTKVNAADNDMRAGGAARASTRIADAIRVHEARWDELEAALSRLSDTFPSNAAMSTDAHGHQHKGAGPGGGQFTSGSGGGSDDSLRSGSQPQSHKYNSPHHQSVSEGIFDIADMLDMSSEQVDHIRSGIITADEVYDTNAISPNAQHLDFVATKVQDLVGDLEAQLTSGNAWIPSVIMTLRSHIAHIFIRLRGADPRDYYASRTKNFLQDAEDIIKEQK